MEAIKSNELRIGNLVTYMNKHILSINGYIIKSIESNEIENIDCGYIPIPLTEELLLKLDAIKLEFKNYPCFNLKGLQISYINGMWIEYVSRIEIKGLHHLQNIFYFRMNEELTIK